MSNTFVRWLLIYFKVFIIEIEFPENLAVTRACCSPNDILWAGIKYFRIRFSQVTLGEHPALKISRMWLAACYMTAHSSPEKWVFLGAENAMMMGFFYPGYEVNINTLSKAVGNPQSREQGNKNQNLTTWSRAWNLIARNQFFHHHKIFLKYWLISILAKLSLFTFKYSIQVFFMASIILYPLIIDLNTTQI